MLYCCGVDEAGYGAGAAQVYVSACILDSRHEYQGLTDSKKLTPGKREILAAEIKEHALAWSIASASLKEIEELNILRATLLAMKRAVEGLSIRPDKVYVDGLNVPEIDIPAVSIVKGDSLIPAISAASILAKVARDSIMLDYHKLYPEYGFDRHKGYLTEAHLKAIRTLGPCPIHRKTFRPIKECLTACEA